MTKRIVAMMLVFVMVLSLVPAVVVAEETAAASPKAGTHTAGAHSAECTAHCGSGVTWTAWDGTVAKLKAGGHYYLTANTTLTGEVQVDADLHLCLNGYVLTAATNKRLFSTKGDTDVTVVISDCTAYMQDGQLVAGTIAGGNDTSSTGGGAIFVRREGEVNLYNIRLVNNVSKTTGGAIMQQAASGSLAGGKVTITGCYVAGNKAISGTTAKEGGAIRVSDGCVLEVKNSVFSNNSGSNGGAIRATGGSVIVADSTFTGNSAAKGAVFYTTGKATLDISGSTITGNTATTAGSVMYMAGVSVKIADSRITGNSCSKKDTGGAVYMGGESCKLILSGQVYIAENTTANTEDVLLYYAANDVIYVDGLAEGSYVEFAAPKATTPVASDLVVVDGTQEKWDPAWLAFRNAAGELKYIGKDSTGFIFLDELPMPVIHTHCVCGSVACTAHTQVTYEAWDGDVAKLANGGKYYLTQDVTMSAEVAVAKDLELCLCGYTLTAAANSRHFSTAEGGNVTITVSDCTAKTEGGVYTAGSLTGGNSAKDGGAIYLHKNNTLYWYDGILSGNKSAATGGAIHVNSNAQAHLYGGLIENNTATGNSGALHANSSCQVTLQDVTIRNNTTGSSRYGGAIYVNSTAQVTISGNTVVSGNKKGTTTNNIHMAGSSLLTVKDLGDNANVGISGAERAFTGETSDWSANFFSDSSKYQVAYQDGKLHLAVPFSHTHCQCGKSDCTDATHKKIAYAAWDKADALSTSGNYCLTKDVVMTAEAAVTKDLNLCLCGHTVTAAANSRHISTADGAAVTITIADCTAKTESGVYTAGAFIGGDSAKEGGAIYLHKSNTLYLYDGILSGNKAGAAGGAIHVNANAQAYLYGGLIENNTATGNSGAINTGAGSKLLLQDVTIRNNTTSRYGGAIYVNSTAQVTISGNTVVSGNKKGTATNNMHMAGSSLLELTNVGADASVGISGAERAFTKETTDLTANFFSDSAEYRVEFRDSKLHLAPSFRHVHCECGKTDCTDPNHQQINYAAWKATDSLPDAGNYCLTQDVTITKEVTLKEDLNLCLCGHKVTGANAKVRFYSTSGAGGEVLTIADCTAKTEDGVYTAGGFYDNTNNNTSAAGGAFFIRAGGTLRFYDGIVSGCSSVAGGAAVYGKDAELTIYNAQITGNKAVSGTSWKNGGAFYLSGCTLTIYDGQFTGNESSNGAAIYTTGSCTVDIRGGSFSGNVAHANNGALSLSATSTLKLSGNPVIMGNTLESGAASNVYLGGTAVMQVGEMDQNAKVGVTATAFRAISTETQDYTENFLSDNPKIKIVYQNNVLYTDAEGNHKHCLCAGSSAVGCDHSTVTYIEWDDPTSLPATGNYYLSVDVVVSSQSRVEQGAMNLCLNGHTVTVGEGGSRIYYLSNGGTLNISDCAGGGKLTGATKAAILANSAGTDMQINLYAGNITGNRNETSGAAVVVQGDCEFNMYGGKITNNAVASSLALDASGAPVLNAKGDQTVNAVNGGAVYLGAGTVFNMYNGEISGNTAAEATYQKADGTTAYDGGKGGAIYMSGVANLYGGKLTGNTGKLGGAVCVYGTNGKLNLLGVEISGNQATSGGGVLSQSGAAINMTAGKVCGNTSAGTGGGVYVSTGTTLNMSGGSVSDNVAISNGTLKNGGGIYLLASTANLSGGTISGNKAANGGGVFMGLSGTRYATLTISDDVVFTGNSATAAGGAVSASGEGTTVTMTGGTIRDNSAKNGGGIIMQTKSALTLEGGKITGNTCTSAGAGVYISTNASIVMTGGSIDGNTATGDCGGICLLRSTGTFKGGSISNNVGYNYAGMRISGATVTIHNLTMVGNKAIGKPAADGKRSGGNAGAIFAGQQSYTEGGVKKLAVPKLTIYNIYAANNSANNAGGAMLIQSKGTVFNMYGGTFTRNAAPNGSGGAIYISTNVVATISGGSFYGNNAKAAGAINFLGSQAELSNVKIYENTAKSQGGAAVIGRETAVVSMKNMEIRDNVCEGAAGAILVQSSATFTTENVKFIGNECATSGGAMYFGNPCAATLRDTEFTNNQSAGIGGAVHVHANADVTMEDVTVSGNTALGDYGGGISTRGRLVIRNSKVLNNTSTGDGGGIGTGRANSINLGDSNGLFATDVIFSGNTAGGQGGAIYGHRGGPVYLENCSISDNTVKNEGSAVYSDGRLSLMDTTITENTSENSGFAVYMTASEFDGHSYSTGFKKLGGDVIVRDNQGGDMFIGEGTGVAVVGEAIGEKTHIEITLHSGVLSEHLFGVYGYEGGNLVYTVTAGDRSVTDPEEYQYYKKPVQEETAAEPAAATQPAAETGNDALLYVVIGVAAAALIAIGVGLVIKKKKAGKPAEKAKKD